MSNLYNFIIMPNNFESFDFNSLTLEQPISLQNNNYFTKLTTNNNPLVIQTLKSKTKQGIVKTGKKWICDLVFDNTSEKIIDWFSNLENKCKELLFEKGNIWFQTPLTQSDIDDTFISIVKVFKSGKQYITRTNIKSSPENDAPVIKIYNESHTTLQYDYLTNDMFINCLLEIKGIKFSLKNFQIEIEIKHILVLEEDKYLQDIYISKTGAILNKSIIENNKLSTNSIESHDINLYSRNQTECLPPGRPEGAGAQLNIYESERIDINKIDNDIDDNVVTQKNTILNQNISSKFEPNKLEVNAYTRNGAVSCPPGLPEGAQSQTNVYESEQIDIDELNLGANDIKNKSEFMDIDKEELINEFDNFEEVDYSNDIKELSEHDIEQNMNKDDAEVFKLKDKKEYYKDLYKVAKNKAKDAKKNAILAYLEAKEIKNTYMVEGDNSDFEKEIDSTTDDDLNF